MTYKIKLPEFEGPFDLLLFFIERDELDIYDIPISKVTDDFLEYIQNIDLINIDVASEFIIVASTLMRIKAKMLLPRKEVDESGNEIDPRDELVQRLLEYKRYKDVLIELRQLEDTRKGMHIRGNISDELFQITTKAMADAELENLTLFSLLKAYENVLYKFDERKTRIVHSVVKFNYSVEERRSSLLNSLKANNNLSFKRIFTSCANRLHAIYTFLAILELLQLEEVSIEQGTDSNDFNVVPYREEKEPEFTENQQLALVNE